MPFDSTKHGPLPAYPESGGAPLPAYSPYPTGATLPGYSPYPADQSLPAYSYQASAPQMPYQATNVIMPVSPTINVSIQGNQAPNVLHQAFGPDPICVVCPICRVTMTTVVTTEYGSKAWIGCGLLALLGFWIGCCLIPFCIDSLNYKVHKCSHCHAFIGRYIR